VEVHFSPGAEAYVTPVGARRVGLAFLFEEGTAPGFDALLERFPALASRLAGASFDSALAGAGPLGRNASARVLPRLVLAGDAGGYVDAITGEGVSLALQEAVLLGELLPEALTRGATREALLPWDRAVRARHLRHAAVTRLVLGMARRPALRRVAVTILGRAPRLFDALVAGAVG
jgi:flavin-dependent dehydrogenase